MSTLPMLLKIGLCILATAALGRIALIHHHDQEDLPLFSQLFGYAFFVFPYLLMALSVRFVPSNKPAVFTFLALTALVVAGGIALDWLIFSHAKTKNSLDAIFYLGHILGAIVAAVALRLVVHFQGKLG